MKYEKPKLINLNAHSMSSEGLSCSAYGSGATGFCMSGRAPTTYACQAGTNATGSSCSSTGSNAGGVCTGGSSAKGSWCMTGTNATGICNTGPST
jgi:hypothetical protein